MRTVVVAQPIHPEGLRLLSARPDVRVVQPDGPAPEAMMPHMAGAEAALLRGAPFPAELVRAAPRLRIVSRHGVGLDNVPLDLCRERGVTVAHVGDVNAVPVAEHTLALLLAVVKQVPAYDRAVRAGDYRSRERLGIGELDGRTLLILGLGRIGRRVARLAAAFGMRCLGHDPALSADAVRALGPEPAEDWRAALPEADAITLHLPLTPETRDLVGPAELARLRPGAILVNCSRGGLVDELALDRALRDGALSGAGLDVLAAEPPPADHPLLTNRRAILSPHAAALTAECARRMAVRSAQNVLDFFDGRLDPAFVA